MTSKDRDGNAMFDIVSKWGKREKIYVEKTPENQDATRRLWNHEHNACRHSHSSH